MHEVCHHEASNGSHTHDEHFYREFHDLLRECLPKFVKDCVHRDRDNAGCVTAESYCERTMEILHLWRNRITRLRGAGWADVSGPKAQWLRNCPPTHVDRDEKRQLRACNLAKVCPWCWSRQHGSDLYQKLVDFLFPGPGKITDGPWYRIGVKTSSYLAPVGGRFTDAIYHGCGYADVMHRVHLRKAVGSCHHNVIYPHKDRWKVSTRLMVLVPEDFCDELPGWRYSRPIVFRKNLIPYVAQFAAYPLGLLTGNEEMMVQYLNANVPLKLKSSFGVLTARGAWHGHNGDASEPEEGLGEGGGSV